MKPVYQTKFASKDGSIKGNCMAACIASLLEIPIEEVPQDLGEDWYLVLFNFLYKKGYYYSGIIEDFEEAKQFEGIDGYMMVAGKSPRKWVKNGHAVIYKNGEIVHDPHPLNEGITEFEYAYKITKLNEII